MVRVVAFAPTGVLSVTPEKDGDKVSTVFGISLEPQAVFFSAGLYTKDVAQPERRGADHDADDEADGGAVELPVVHERVRMGSRNDGFSVESDVKRRSLAMRT